MESREKSGIRDLKLIEDNLNWDSRDLERTHIRVSVILVLITTPCLTCLYKNASSIFFVELTAKSNSIDQSG